MDARTFLGAVLGDDGYYCVWAHRLSDKRKVQKFYPDLDAALHAARNFDEDGYDAYYALGTFVEAGSREAANVKQLRSFFLDLDCGPTKDYDTQDQAVRALQAFCKQLTLPRPTLVNSGRGIHAYWRLAAPVLRDEWLVVANNLKAACKKHGLRTDAGVTADAARVLRVPETHNHKDTPPSPVLVVGAVGPEVDFAAFAQLVAGHGGETFTPSRTFAPREPDPVLDAISGSFVSRFKTIMNKTVAGLGCAQLGEAVQNQENISEPLWRASLSIAKFCVDAHKSVHRLSERHPEYDPDVTEQKVNLIKGPYTCERFNEYRPDTCTECKHWGKIKSPIVLGREVEEAPDEEVITFQAPVDVPNATPIQYTIPKYPYPYFRGKNGGVFKHAKDEDGNPKDMPVYVNDLYVVRRLKDPDMGEAVVMRLHLPKDGVREFTVPLAAVGTKDEFRKCLAMQGVAVLTVADLMEYTMRWVNELQFSIEAEDAQRQFGWVDDSGTCFAAGNMLIYNDHVEINAPSGATVGLIPYFAPKGTLEGWKQTMEFYNRPGMEAHQFMVGLQFGSQLMEFQPINAAAFHMYSKESGLGKTTGMLAGASIWGDPDLLMLQERDTFNSKMNRAEVYKNLAVYMDEMTNTKPQELSDWLYQMPSGLQRNRMGSKVNTERTRGKPWKTLFGTTGNTSMIERISLYKSVPKAEAQRVLEHRVERVLFATKAETDKFAAEIKENYGHAGVMYIQYIMNNLESSKALANSVQKRLDLAAGLTAENRFWSALVSRTITGLMLAKRAGILNWKIEPIVNWIVAVLQRAKNIVSEMGGDVETTLMDYMAENYNSVLRIKSTDDARSTVSTGLDHLIVPDASPRGNTLVARYEYDLKKLYLLPKPLKEWCGKQQINYAGFIEGLTNNRTAACKVKMRLSKGTTISFPPVEVIMVDCSGFLNDETDEDMAAGSTLFPQETAD